MSLRLGEKIKNSPVGVKASKYLDSDVPELEDDIIRYFLSLLFSIPTQNCPSFSS